jgi:hypothetical protein
LKEKLERGEAGKLKTEGSNTKDRAIAPEARMKVAGGKLRQERKHAGQRALAGVRPTGSPRIRAIAHISLVLFAPADEL